MPEDLVRAVYRKYNGALHWNMRLRMLGSDGHGTWLGAPGGSESRRGHEPWRVWPEAYVLLVPHGLWWTAIFNDEPHKTAAYCDITTVPEWSDGVVSMVDLDLDVIQRRDGSVEIDDEDEFLEHQVKYRYPADVIHSARRSCDELAELVRSGGEPFASEYRPWLAAAAKAAPVGR